VQELFFQWSATRTGGIDEDVLADEDANRSSEGARASSREDF
jgi:hypothetical protein